MDKFVERFLIKLAKKFNIGGEEVIALWKKDVAELDVTEKPAPAPSPPPPPPAGNFQLMTVAQLKELCRERKLALGGVKNDLIKRLETLVAPVEGPRFFLDERSGYYVHHETSLVINQDTDLIFGRLGSTGNLHRLTAADIDQCREFKFKWDINAIAVSPPCGFVNQNFEEESDVESAAST